MKRKIWLPLLTATATVATVVPAITSCRPGLMGTHDMLEPNYIHHVIPSLSRTVTTEALFAQTYFKDVSEYTDIIKDDILFTYSKLLTNDTYKNNLDFDFTRYFLYIDDIEVDYEKGIIDFKLWAEITGTTKTDKVASHKTIDGTNYLRDFTLVLGAHYSEPLSMNKTLYGKQTADPFKDMYCLNLVNSANAVRVQALGTVGLSTTETGNITQTTISEDETSVVGTATNMSNLFNDLIYTIPQKALGKADAGFYFISYYFKNVKVVE